MGIRQVIDLAVEVEIDELTPCLINALTNEVVDTTYALATKNELKNLQGWLFDWSSTDLKKSSIYKLIAENDDTIQGLVAINDHSSDQAIYVKLVESAPHNKGWYKKYKGVGGHLFAIAALISVQKGYGGFLFLDAKNMELVEHYHSTLGAVLWGRPHKYRMIVDEEKAHALLEKYTFNKEG
jgi:hypothetical protein